MGDLRALSQADADKLLDWVARGGHLVEDDLIPLLDSGQLAGAALDVFEQEPLLDPAHPLLRHPRVLSTPHGTPQCVIRITGHCAVLVTLLDGQPRQHAFEGR